MNLKAAPFFLSDLDIKWVEKTLNQMNVEEKIGQLFCPIGYSTDPEYLQYELLSKHIGGLFFRDGFGEEMRNTFEFAQNHTRIPLLIPSNLEAGGDGAAIDGTAFGKQMEVAASRDAKHAYRLGKVACSEAAALGINWSFAPVVDLDLNYHNPITNVRTYGDDPERVITMAKEYLKAADEEGVAVSIKHFPGDGVDERDQHLLTSVNTMTLNEWDNSFGRIYSELISANAKTVMVGHIALPSYEEYFEGKELKQILPASLSQNLIKNLLRDKLGFQGLVITDATPMIGFTSAMSRKKAVPYAIEAGCDMFLFNKNISEDYDFMMQGYKTGILSKERLDEANTRILALKASLGLHEKKRKGTLVPPKAGLKILNCRKHNMWAKELADESITLVKDSDKILPIKASKTPRILLQILGDFPSNDRVVNLVKMELEKRNFQIYLYEKENFEVGVDNVAEFKSKYDMVIYLGNVENASNRTTNRINWYTFWGQGNNVPWFVKEVPVIFISLANPYHLLDVPMIGTYINTYSNNIHVIEAVVSKIAGESEFKGQNPVDPFCGRKELKY